MWPLHGQHMPKLGKRTAQMYEGSMGAASGRDVCPNGWALGLSFYVY